MAKVRLSVPAVSDLDRMIITHSLPGDTRLRVQRSLRVLEQFPRIGRQLDPSFAHGCCVGEVLGVGVVEVVTGGLVVDRVTAPQDLGWCGRDHVVR